MVGFRFSFVFVLSSSVVWILAAISSDESVCLFHGDRLFDSLDCDSLTRFL